MPIYKDPDGKFTAIICTRGRKQNKACVTCGKPGGFLCDYPVLRNGKAATCDRACCADHKVHVGKDADYCLAHAAVAK